MKTDIIKEYLSRCEQRLDNSERELDLARDELKELLELFTVCEDIEDFLYDIANDDNLPETIRDKANDLWRKV